MKEINLEGISKPVRKIIEESNSRKSSLNDEIKFSNKHDYDVHDHYNDEPRHDHYRDEQRK
jgi:hypothetical protein